MEYLEDYCWLEGTVPVRNRETIPETEVSWDEYDERRICKLLFF